MEKAKHSVQFQAEVDSAGKVSFSKQVSDLQLKPGTAVTVNIFGGVISERLKKLNATEAEIEQIVPRLESYHGTVTFSRVFEPVACHGETVLAMDDGEIRKHSVSSHTESGSNQVRNERLEGG